MNNNRKIIIVISIILLIILLYYLPGILFNPLTVEKYEQIKIGMTKEEVISILGDNYDLDDFGTCEYTWRDFNFILKNEFIVINFENEKVIEKYALNVKS
jgi:hypothetical protein